MLKTNTLHTALLMIGFVFVLSGCDIINPEEQVPSYIEIEDIIVNEDNSQVTDAWVYVDGFLIGSFDLPAHIPVLKSGISDVTVRAGIRVNGIAVTRGYYPFYEDWTTEVTLKEGETITLTPETQYKSGLDFKWRENFESVALTMEPLDTTKLNFEKTDTVSNATSETVGGIALGTDSIFSVQTILDYELPATGPVYLELSFKSEIPFELAWRVENLATTVTNDNRLYQFSPSDEWQHVYIYLSSFIATYDASISRFRILLGAANVGDEKKYIYVDNIKLIHF